VKRLRLEIVSPSQMHLTKGKRKERRDAEEKQNDHEPYLWHKPPAEVKSKIRANAPCLAFRP
jgi:hypothetical protein